MWTSPDSEVAQEIARLERELHDTKYTDHETLIGVRHRLAAFRWLHDTVETLATKRPGDGEVVELVQPGRIRRLFDTVLPTRLG